MRSLEFLNGGIMESGMSSSRPSLPVFHCSNIPLSEQCHWLLSRRADFWLACGGASIGLLAAILLIFLRGDRELDAIDFVLSEFHLGATYDAILRRRLWRHRKFDVLLIPLVILALTYALSLGGQTILTHVDRHVRCRLAPRAPESGSGALLPARHGRAGVADP